MTQRFLTAKHWQLFLFTTVLPIVMSIVFFAFMLTQIIPQMTKGARPQPPDLTGYWPVMIVFFLISLVATFVQLRWQWMLAVNLQPYLNPDMRKLKVKRFKIFFFFPWIYLVLISALMISIVPFDGRSEPNFDAILAFIPFMFLGHFFMMFCVIYTMYFAAKTICSVELQREAHFSDYIGEFFLIWFHFVGVWLLQPRVNVIAAGSLPQKPEEASNKPIDKPVSGNTSTGSKDEQAGQDFLDRHFK